MTQIRTLEYKYGTYGQLRSIEIVGDPVPTAEVWTIDGIPLVSIRVTLPSGQSKYIEGIQTNYTVTP